MMNKILRATRNLQLATCLLLLTSCGFQPMYGDHSAFVKTTPLAGNLKIEGIDGRYGQIFKIALEDKLNPQGLKNKSPEYRLKVGLKKNEIAAVVKSDGTIQRYNIRFDSNFSLLDAKGKVLLSGDMRRTGSYNTVVNANFAVYQAERDTSERILKELAEDYVLRLSGYFAGKQE